MLMFLSYVTFQVSQFLEDLSMETNKTFFFSNATFFERFVPLRRSVLHNQINWFSWNHYGKAANLIITVPLRVDNSSALGFNRNAIKPESIID